MTVLVVRQVRAWLVAMMSEEREKTRHGQTHTETRAWGRREGEMETPVLSPSLSGRMQSVAPDRLVNERHAIMIDS